MKGNEEDWWMIKTAMTGYLKANISRYQHGFHYDTNHLLELLRHRASPYSPDYWFLVPDCAQLLADMLSVPVAVYTGTGRNSQLFLPIEKEPSPIIAPIVLQLINNNYFVLISVKRHNFPWPPPKSPTSSCMHCTTDRR